MTQKESKSSSIILKILTAVTICSVVICILLMNQYTKEKESHLSTQVSLNTVKNNYDSLLKDYSELEKSYKINEKTITELNQVINSKNKEVSAVEKTVNNKIDAIIKKYEGMEKTETNRIAMEREISAERVRGLWAVFCLENKQHESCR